MRSYPGDLTPVVLAVAGALVFVVVISRLFSWYRWRALRLCLLTGTRPQRAALRVALAPVVREFLPLLDKAGQQVLPPCMPVGIKLPLATLMLHSFSGMALPTTMPGGAFRAPLI